jgi:hypothetical protein
MTTATFKVLRHTCFRDDFLSLCKFRFLETRHRAPFEDNVGRLVNVAPGVGVAAVGRHQVGDDGEEPSEKKTFSSKLLSFVDTFCG